MLILLETTWWKATPTPTPLLRRSNLSSSPKVPDEAKGEIALFFNSIQEGIAAPFKNLEHEQVEKLTPNTGWTDIEPAKEEVLKAMIDVNQAFAVPLLTGGEDYVQHVVPDGGLLVALVRGKKSCMGIKPKTIRSSSTSRSVRGVTL